jgi:hypothetical protein
MAGRPRSRARRLRSNPRIASGKKAASMAALALGLSENRNVYNNTQRSYMRECAQKLQKASGMSWRRIKDDYADEWSDGSDAPSHLIEGDRGMYDEVERAVGA